MTLTLKAVEGYKFDQGGSFLTYLTYHVKNSFNRVLGLRTSRDRNDPMRYAASLDAPFEDVEDLTLKDMIIDHMSEEDYRFIEDEEFWKDVHELLEETIIEVTSGSIQEALLTMLHENCILSEACRRIGLPQDKQHGMYERYHKALRHIRRYLRGQALKRCQQAGIDDYFSIGYCGSGLGAYRNHGFTSATERAAIQKADREGWNKKVVEMMG